MLRAGTTVVYEWAIPLYERFPDRPFRIGPGKTIGFDLAINDVDGQDKRSLVFWTPEGKKSRNSNLYGDLVFAARGTGLRATLSRLAGRVTDGAAGWWVYVIAPVMLVALVCLVRRIRRTEEEAAATAATVEEPPARTLV